METTRDETTKNNNTHDGNKNPIRRALHPRDNNAFSKYSFPLWITYRLYRTKSDQ